MARFTGKALSRVGDKYKIIYGEHLIIIRMILFEFQPATISNGEAEIIVTPENWKVIKMNE